VVNYDLPNVPEDYVHRIGRTGRAGATGEAVSLVCVDEHIMLRDIERLIKQSLPREIIPGFEPDPTARPQPIQLRSGNAGHGNGGRSGQGRGQGQRSGGGNRSGAGNSAGSSANGNRSAANDGAKRAAGPSGSGRNSSGGPRRSDAPLRTGSRSR
jgi:ATP-dependent RNA helicase RhlE